MHEAAPTNPGPSNRELGALANDLVSLHKATCGRGPTEAVAHAGGETITCVLRGGLTKADKTLMQHGDVGVVINQRERLHHVMRADATSLVERHTRRKVATVLFACDPADEVEVLVFLLAADDGEPYEVDELSRRREV